MLKKIIITVIIITLFITVPFIFAFTGVLNGLSDYQRLIILWTVCGLLIYFGIIYLGTED